MFVLCVVSKIQKTKCRTIKTKNQEKKTPGVGEIFRTSPGRPRGPPSFLYSGYPVFLPGVKRPRRGVIHGSPSSGEVKEIVELSGIPVRLS